MNTFLKEKLERISSVFDLEKLESSKIDTTYIQDYYLKNKIPYSLFHTTSNFVHMGISHDEIFRKGDLLEHAIFIDEYIKKIGAEKVLELATGRGANSTYLALQNPNTEFFGIDLSDEQLSFAKRAATKQGNFKICQGDFHELTQFEDDSFDLIFIIEALCHSNNSSKVFAETKRLLKKNGVFIVFDGYLGAKDLSEEELIAKKITERSMAVKNFLKYSDFKKLAADTKFELLEEQDFSKEVIPTMQKFEKLANRFFKHPKLAKIVSRILPEKFTYNAISGSLMPILFETKVFEYWRTVFINR